MLKKNLFLLFLFFLFAKSSLAVYDPLTVPNNRFGVHLLEPAEVNQAAKFVNSSGGDWGYVTIPIRADDRDLPKWTQFMNDSKELHIIPIIRISTFASGEFWMAPNEYDLIDFANFLDQLPWPIQNRYVIVYNEPNHVGEWGGFIYPEEYAQVLDRAIDIFHKKNPDFFVISAGFDASAPNSPRSLNEYDYLRIMNNRAPGIFNRIDGFATHSYGNPGFSSFPNLWSSVSVANYRFEENFLSALGVSRPKIFITEGGWNTDLTGNPVARNFYQAAFRNIWTDDNIVAITPFVYEAQAGPFLGFSFLDKNGNLKPFAKSLEELPKIAGRPQVSQNIPGENDKINPVWTGNSPPTSSFDLIGSLKAIFSLIFPGGR